MSTARQRLERLLSETPDGSTVLSQILKGDRPGHQFHGNQWTGGKGGFIDHETAMESGDGKTPARYESGWPCNPYSTDLQSRIIESGARNINLFSDEQRALWYRWISSSNGIRNRPDENRAFGEAFANAEHLPEGSLVYRGTRGLSAGGGMRDDEGKPDFVTTTADYWKQQVGKTLDFNTWNSTSLDPREAEMFTSKGNKADERQFSRANSLFEIRVPAGGAATTNNNREQEVILAPSSYRVAGVRSVTAERSDKPVQTTVITLEPLPDPKVNWTPDWVPYTHTWTIDGQPKGTVTKGDRVGHEFHGNQYTEGNGKTPVLGANGRPWIPYSLKQQEEIRQIGLVNGRAMTNDEQRAMAQWIVSSDTIRTHPEGHPEFGDAMARSQHLDEGSLVYRGTTGLDPVKTGGSRLATTTADYWQQQVGKTLEFNTWNSTSLDPSTGERFSGRGTAKDIDAGIDYAHTLFEIHVPKDGATPIINPREQEVILAPSSYRIAGVRSVEEERGDGTHQYNTITLEPSADPKVNWHPDDVPYTHTWTIDGQPKGTVTKGDRPGHAFHGNQWVPGSAVEGIPEDIHPRHIDAPYEATINRGPKATPAEAAATIKRNVAEFEAAGGHIISVDDIKPEDQTAITQTLGKIEYETRQKTREASKGETVDGFAYDEWSRLGNGIVLTKHAIWAAESGNQTIVAVDDHGHVVGALDYRDASNLKSPFFDVGSMGSLGTIPGIGSALQAELIRRADATGIRVKSTATQDAVPFHLEIGRTLGRGWAPSSSWSAATVHKIATELAKAYYDYDSVSPIWQSDFGRALLDSMPTINGPRLKGKKALLALIERDPLTGRTPLSEILKGDRPGHPFRGNQYTGGRGRSAWGEPVPAEVAQVSGTGKTPSEWSNPRAWPSDPYSHDLSRRLNVAAGNVGRELSTEQAVGLSGWFSNSSPYRLEEGMYLSSSPSARTLQERDRDMKREGLAEALEALPKLDEGSLVYRGLSYTGGYKDSSGNPISPAQYWSEQIGGTIETKTLNSTGMSPLAASNFAPLGEMGQAVMWEMKVGSDSAAVTYNLSEREAVLSPGSFRIVGVTKNGEPVTSETDLRMPGKVLVSMEQIKTGAEPNWKPDLVNASQTWTINGQPKKTLPDDATKGDKPGHAFRGNQYTGGRGGDSMPEHISAQDALDHGDGKISARTETGMVSNPYSHDRQMEFASAANRMEQMTWGDPRFEQAWADWVDDSESIRMHYDPQQVDDFLTLMQHSEMLPEGSIVYRGTAGMADGSGNALYRDSEGNPVSNQDYWKQQVGRTIDLNTLNSTSIDPRVATSFGRESHFTDEAQTYTLFEIHTAPDSAAITGNLLESEAVLAPSQYKISSVEVLDGRPDKAGFSSAPGNKGDTTTLITLEWSGKGPTGFDSKAARTQVDRDRTWSIEGAPKGVLAKGDKVGHKFHGNQWTGGLGGDSMPEHISAEDAIEHGDGKISARTETGMVVNPYSLDRQKKFIESAEFMYEFTEWTQTDRLDAYNQWVVDSEPIRMHPMSIVGQDFRQLMQWCETLPEGSIVYRGTTGLKELSGISSYKDADGNPISHDDYWQQQVGKTIDLNTLNATSIDPAVAIGFGRESGREDEFKTYTLFEIHVAPDSAAIIGNDKEAEAVLAPSQYKVTSVESLQGRPDELGANERPDTKNITTSLITLEWTGKGPIGFMSDAARVEEVSRDRTWSIEGQPKGVLAKGAHARKSAIISRLANGVVHGIVQAIKGDLPGHAFHGNQYTGGRGTAHGRLLAPDYTELANSVNEQLRQVMKKPDWAEMVRGNFPVLERRLDADLLPFDSSGLSALGWDDQRTLRSILIGSKLDLSAADAFDVLQSFEGIRIDTHGFSRVVDESQIGVDSHDIKMTPAEEVNIKFGLADVLQRAWFGDSGSEAKTKLLEAAKDEFGVTDAKPPYEGTMFRFGPGFRADIPTDVWRSYLRAQYEVTQDVLSGAGFKPNDTIPLWRGATAETLGLGSDVQQGDSTTSSLRPLSAWSFRQERAGTYAHMAPSLTGQDNTATRVVYSADVPVRDIGSAFFSGMGDMPSSEALVIGRPQKITVEKVEQQAIKGDKPGHQFRGNQWTGPMPGTGDTPQELLANAHIIETYGISRSKIRDYLLEHGQVFEGRPCPPDYEEGEPNECFANASKLVMDEWTWGDGELLYCEGVVSMKGDPTLSIIHGWAVDAEGNVVDNTLTDPENWNYLGVTYDWEPYSDHIADTGYYGVLGGQKADAERVMDEGGLHG